MNWIMPLAALWLLLEAAMAIAIARAWPLVHDAPLIHYVIFLMDHGWAPYRDIVEINMPGTYMVQWVAIHVFGGGAFGWWLWDTLSGVAAVVAGAWIAGAGRRWAGTAGGAFAYLIHFRGGAWNLGQRDWIVAVMLLLAFGCLFEAIRKRSPAWMTGFMGLCGLAASIKPPVIGIGVCFLIAMCWMEWRKQGTWRQAAQRSKNIIVWSLVGGLIPAMMVAIFLLRWGVLGEFSAVLHGLVPFYAGLQRVASLTLLRRAVILPLPILPLLVGAGLLFLLGQSWRRWESNLLAAASLAGLALFLIQGKGWEYHLYPEIAFVSLWGMLELDRGLRGVKLERFLATTTLLATVLAATPWLLKARNATTYPMETIAHLEKDLNSYGGARLSGKIQCLDMTMGGCINVLYRMKLVQSTGFIYDFYLFPDHANAVTEALRARFLREITAHPPEMIVLSSHTWPGDTYSYDQLKTWPFFNDLLERSYRLDRELPKQRDSAGYRIYVLAAKLKKEPSRVF